jgi:hypothetical protein
MHFMTLSSTFMKTRLYIENSEKKLGVMHGVFLAF